MFMSFPVFNGNACKVSSLRCCLLLEADKEILYFMYVQIVYVLSQPW